MESIKSDIQSLPFLQQVALMSWLSQQIQSKAESQAVEGKLLLDQGDPKSPPNWMWDEAAKNYKNFKNSEESGLNWDDVKALGDKRKSA